MQPLRAICALLHVLIFKSAVATGPFTDVTEQMGLTRLPGDVAASGEVAASGDFNRDGYADLCTGGQLWKNQHGRSFERVASVTFAGPGVWGDFNNDGPMNIFRNSTLQSTAA